MLKMVLNLVNIETIYYECKNIFGKSLMGIINKSKITYIISDDS